MPLYFWILITIGLVILLTAIIPNIVLWNSVYKSTYIPDARYHRSHVRIYGGYDMWTHVVPIIPGVLYFKVGTPFYLDDEGFYQ